MLNIKDYSDVFIIKKERDDYVIKEYIGDIKGTLVIPEGVTKISREAFSYSWIKSYPEITKIVFPSTLKAIPNCFSSWKHLKEIAIPEGIISIAEHAFFDTGIREVSLPSTIDKIGSGAFALCEDLDRITITHLSSTILNNLFNSEYISYSNNGEQKLAFSLFFGLSQEIELTDFFRYYNTNNDKYKFTLNNSFVLYGNYIIGYIGNEKHLTTPDCAIGVAEEAFIYNRNIKSIKLNDKIKSIGNCAFEGCKYLETVYLNETLETIGHFAFADTGIKNITIPPKVKNMGESVFIDCKHLDTIIITEKLTGDYRTHRWDSNWKNGFYKTPQYKFI